MKASHPFFGAVPLWARLTLLGACSNAELYHTGQSWQQQACRKLPDMAERSRCEKSNSVAYEKYREQTQASQARTP